MLISKDSPLRRIPYELDRKEALFIDGMRFTIEMIDVAYRRLIWMLERIAIDDSYRKNNPMAESFMEAWSIIDSIHRLRSLIAQAPGIKQKEIPERRMFLDRTKGVENFRHTVQHLNREIEQLAIDNEPVWGSLNWFAVVELYPKDNIKYAVQRIKTGCWCGMISGSVIVAKPYKLGVIPKKATIKDNASLILLRSGKNYLPISKYYEYIKDFKEALERYITSKYKELPDVKLDVYIFCKVEFEKDE